MKEFHAYKNDDGTYKVEDIAETHYHGELIDVTIKIARAKISIESLVVPDSAELYTTTIYEENENENTKN